MRNITRTELQLSLVPSVLVIAFVIYPLFYSWYNDITCTIYDYKTKRLMVDGYLTGKAVYSAWCSIDGFTRIADKKHVLYKLDTDVKFTEDYLESKYHIGNIFHCHCNPYLQVIHKGREFLPYGLTLFLTIVMILAAFCMPLGLLAAISVDRGNRDRWDRRERANSSADQ